MVSQVSKRQADVTMKNIEVMRLFYVIIDMCDIHAYIPIHVMKLY